MAHMVQSVELLLDDAVDARVRSEWDVLADLGLPSQSRHRGASNRPHVTVGVAAQVTDNAEERLRSACTGTRFAVRLGGLLVFGGPRAVVARAVVPSEELLALHRRVFDALAESPGVPPHLEPGGYTPHVTLARRLTHDQVGAAVAALTPSLGDLVGVVSSVRRWDGDAKVEWTIA